MTGAGRSTAAKELEDLGFFVVDNLPPAAGRRRGPARRRDPRARGSRSPSWSTYAPGRSSRPAGGHRAAARPDAAPRCCSSRPPTRCWSAGRRPPAGRTRSRRAAGCSTACAASAIALDDLRADADLVIDTTGLNVHQLTDQRRATPSAPSRRTSLQGDGGELRVQVRHPRRRRPGRRHAVPAQPALGARAAPAVRARRGGRATTSRAARRPRSSSTSTSRCSQTVGAGYLREGKRFMTVAIGCTGGKHRSVAMTEEIAARLRAPRASTPGRCTATWGGSDDDRTRRTATPLDLGWSRSAAGTAWRRPWPRCGASSTDLTAVVTVADNGGSSGRLRREFGVLPPGDLRQALSALCGDDDWGRTWARVLQHRFASDGEMDNHAVGNLLIVALWELLGDHVGGARLGGPAARGPGPGAADGGRPRSTSPPTVRGPRPGRPRRADHGPRPGRGGLDRRPGASPCTSTRRTRPPARRRSPPSTDADWVVLGPGSWFTSVIPHLLVPELRRALVAVRGPQGGHAQPGAAGGGDRRVLARDAPRGARRARPRPAARRGARRPRRRCVDHDAAASGSRGRSAPSWWSPTWPSATAPRGTTRSSWPMPMRGFSAEA